MAISLSAKGRFPIVETKRNIEKLHTCVRPDYLSYQGNGKVKNDSIAYLLIDAQVDFYGINIKELKYESAFKDGIENSNEQVANTVKMMQKSGTQINCYVTTRDGHKELHIAHPHVWTLNDTEEPPPLYSTIDLDDNDCFVCTPLGSDSPLKCAPSINTFYYEGMEKNFSEYAKQYITLLKRQRIPGIDPFKLTIWPPHCLIGSIGQTIMPEIQLELQAWEVDRQAETISFTKGNNILTEAYSALRPEVIIAEDPTSHFNDTLMKRLLENTFILVSGQAMSHCVNFTIRDFVNEVDQHVGKKKYKRYFDSKRVITIVILTDTMGAVKGSEKAAFDFINDLCWVREAARINGQKYMKQELEPNMRVIDVQSKYVMENISDTKNLRQVLEECVKKSEAKVLMKTALLKLKEKNLNI